MQRLARINAGLYYSQTDMLMGVKRGVDTDDDMKNAVLSISEKHRGPDGKPLDMYTTFNCTSDAIRVMCAHARNQVSEEQEE